MTGEEPKKQAMPDKAAREAAWRLENKEWIKAHNERVDREGVLIPPYWAREEGDSDDLLARVRSETAPLVTADRLTEADIDAMIEQARDEVAAEKDKRTKK